MCVCCAVEVDFFASLATSSQLPPSCVCVCVSVCVHNTHEAAVIPIRSLYVVAAVVVVSAVGVFTTRRAIVEILSVWCEKDMTV